MNEKVLTEYIKVLVDQRTNLEFQVIQLSNKVKELESAAADRTEQDQAKYKAESTQ